MVLFYHHPWRPFPLFTLSISIGNSSSDATSVVSPFSTAGVQLGSRGVVSVGVALVVPLVYVLNVVVAEKRMIWLLCWSAARRSTREDGDGFGGCEALNGRCECRHSLYLKTCSLPLSFFLFLLSSFFLTFFLEKARHGISPSPIDSDIDIHSPPIPFHSKRRGHLDCPSRFERFFISEDYFDRGVLPFHEPRPCCNGMGLSLISGLLHWNKMDG